MKKFIEENGMYNYTSFEAQGLVFTIIGSESNPNSKKLMDTIDTFKSSKGVYSERTRREIQQAFIDGKITPVESSLIKDIRTDGKTKRRAV